MSQIDYYGSSGHVEGMCYRLSWYLEAYERREISVIEGILVMAYKATQSFSTLATFELTLDVFSTSPPPTPSNLQKPLQPRAPHQLNIPAKTDQSYPGIQLN